MFYVIRDMYESLSLFYVSHSLFLNELFIRVNAPFVRSFVILVSSVSVGEGPLYRQILPITVLPNVSKLQNVAAPKNFQIPIPNSKE